MTNIATDNPGANYQNFVTEIIDIVHHHRIQAVRIVQSYTYQIVLGDRRTY